MSSRSSRYSAAYRMDTFINFLIAAEIRYNNTDDDDDDNDDNNNIINNNNNNGSI